MIALKIDPYLGENIQLGATDLTSHRRFNLNHPWRVIQEPTMDFKFMRKFFYEGNDILLLRHDLTSPNWTC